MIFGCNLQVPLRSESYGWGTFALASPSIATRSSGKEQSFSLCRSYGDRGGPDPHSDSISFPEPNNSMVENLVGAFINVTEILDGYAHPSCVTAAFNGFLGFENLSQDYNAPIATGACHTHVFQHGETLQLLSHEMPSHGNSMQDSITSPSTTLPVRNVPHAAPRRASSARALRSVWSSSSPVLRSDNSTRAHRDLSVNTVRYADHGRSHHNYSSATSEEDILLQEARFKAFRNQTEGNEWKGLRHESGQMNIAGAHSKKAKDVSDRECESHTALEGLAESGKFCFFADRMTLSQENCLFWGGLALSMFLAVAFLATCQSRFFMRGRLQRPSVKRRILKSQWYGNSGSQSWGHRNFQMRVSDFPKYPIVEVDGDKQQLRFPASSNGHAAAFAERGSKPSNITKATHGHPARETTFSEPFGQISTSSMAQGKPIRQTIQGSKALSVQQHKPRKVHTSTTLHGKALSDVDWSSQLSLANDHIETQEEERNAELSLPSSVSAAKRRAHGNVTPHEEFPAGGLHGRRVSDFVQENAPLQRNSRMVSSKTRIDQSHWGKDDELNLDRRIQKLYETIQAVEQHRRAAMLALEEERQRSIALEEEMVKQKEASAVLGEEVRLLKESHNALLTSLQKKYSTLAAARTAADLVYQDWERHAAAG